MKPTHVLADELAGRTFTSNPLRCIALLRIADQCRAHQRAEVERRDHRTANYRKRHGIPRPYRPMFKEFRVLACNTPKGGK
jgi:hypothetical protein